MHYLIGHLLRINHFFHPNSCLSSCGNEEGEGGKKPLSFPDLSSKLPIYAQNITNTAELFEPGINLENLLLLWVSRDLAYLYLLKEPCHWKQSRDYFKWMNNEIAQLSNGFQIPRLAQDTLLGSSSARCSGCGRSTPRRQQVLLHGAITASEENPPSPGVTESCFGKRREDISSFRQYHYGNTHKIINYQKQRFLNNPSLVWNPLIMSEIITLAEGKHRPNKREDFLALKQGQIQDEKQSIQINYCFTKKFSV